MSRLLLVLFLMSSCGAPERVGDGKSEHGGIGAACRRDTDCIRGAACNYYSCDFKNVCSARIDGAAGTSQRVYQYDADGYELGWEEKRAGAVIGFQRWQWAADRRKARVDTYLGDLEKPFVVSDFEYDSNGEQRVVRDDTDGQFQVINWTWSDTWSCRAPQHEVRDGDGAVSSTTRATCAADGTPTRIEWVGPNGDVQMMKDSVFAKDRLVERTTHYYLPEKTHAMRQVFKRDARGAMIGMTIDQGNDGSVEQTEVYDLGCWVVEGGRVSYRP